MQPTIFIATPLEDDQIARISAAAEGRAIVVHEPDLLPPVGYVADHKGREDFVRTAEQQARWKAHLADADFLGDIPPFDHPPTSRMDWAPKLQWVQTTSSGVGPTIRKAGLATSDVIISTARGIHAEPLSEFALLATLMSLPGRTFSRLELLDHLQDSAYEGYERTIDGHIRRLRTKIEPDPRNPRYVETVFGFGYRFAVEEK